MLFSSCYAVSTAQPTLEASPLSFQDQRLVFEKLFSLIGDLGDPEPEADFEPSVLEEEELRSMATTLMAMSNIPAVDGAQVPEADGQSAFELANGSEQVPAEMPKTKAAPTATAQQVLLSDVATRSYHWTQASLTRDSANRWFRFFTRQLGLGDRD